MKITKLELTNFRNYGKKSLELSPDITLIVGQNGAGKTNIIEAIYLLATGTSWRTATTEEMIKIGSPVAHITGHLQTNLHVTLTRGSVNGQRTPRLRFQVDGVSKRKTDFVGLLKVVLFEPESLQIVIGSPQARRAFLDETLTQTHPEYQRSVAVYSKALRARNKLLDRIRAGQDRVEVLEYWERALVKHGTLVQNHRRQFIDWLNHRLNQLDFTYQPNAMSQKRLDQYRDREIIAGHTFVGPHRDRLEFKVQSSKFKVPVELASYGSRGQQRLTVLKLKLSQAEWIKQQTNHQPVVLLDDIFSELDQQHERLVGSLVKGRQAIITATEIHKRHYPEGNIIELT